MAWKNIKARRKYDLEYKRQKQLDMSPEELLAYLATKRAYAKAWRLKNPGHRAKYHAANPEKVRRWRGLPEPTRPMPLVCESCGRPESRKGKRLSLDHCHRTGQFRGWLCFHCNTSLGKLEDDLSGVLKLVNYLVNYYTFSEPNTL